MMIAERVRNRRRTEEYIRQLYATSVTSSGGNDFDSNCRALEQLIAICPGARCGRFDSEFRQVVYSKNIAVLLPRRNFFKIKRNNFHDPLKMMIDIEELWGHIGMRRYDRPRGTISPTDLNESEYKCEVIGISNGHPPIISGDCIVLSNEKQETIIFYIKIEDDWILFTGDYRWMMESRYMSFVSSCIDNDRCSKALREVNRRLTYMSMIFPDNQADSADWAGENPEPMIDFKRTNTPELEERLTKCNQRQRQAIVNILEAKCRPNLYVLFGPPGTGKTSTLIELIIQIYKRAGWARILVCSSANTCVDSIADLIADTDEIEDMVRLISPDKCEKMENIPGYYTTYAAGINQRLVLTTNSSAARLDRRYFDYVIIDEAGHSHIPESLIPLTKLKRDGCFVLAGDPKQLGPTIKCEMIKNLNVSQSLLYHICERALYKSDGGRYNERYITKLVDSYRCDPRILGLCSELFYENELNCLGRTPPRLLEDLELEKPLVFAPVSSDEMRPPLFVSRCNLVEAEKLIDFLITLYKIGLHPDQIGVITPYKLQKDLLNDILRRRIDERKKFLTDLLKSDNKFKYQDVDNLNGPQEGKENPRSPLKPTSSSHYQATDDNVQLDLTNGWTEKTRKPKTKKWMRKFNWICKIDTVDAFQGSEREVILISTVRTPIYNEKIGQAKFLMDLRRFNVAISRAKWLVVVFGHLAVLRCGKAWLAYDEWSARKII